MDFPVKHKSTGTARRIRLRAVVAYPAISVALVAAVALVLAPFGPAQGMALAALATATETLAPIAAPNATATLAPAAAVVTAERHVLARIEGADFKTTYLPDDSPMLNASQTQTFRVRFQLSNTTTGPVTAIPQLEFRPDGGAAFLAVPERAQQGIAFYVAREQVWSLTNLVWEQGPLGKDIAVGELRIPSDVGALAVSGHHSMGVNPDGPITLPAHSYTEQEFTVRLTTEANYLTGYELRITDGGTPLTGSPVAKIRVGPPPSPAPAAPSPAPAAPSPIPAAPSPIPAAPSPIPAAPSPSLPTSASPSPSVPTSAGPSPSPAGQSPGVPVGIPTATSGTGAAYPLAKPSADAAPLALGADTSAGAATPAAAGPNELLYGLVSSTTSLAAAGIGPTPHGPYGLVDGQCAACHRTHTAKDKSLHASPSPQSSWCFTCHDGTGAITNVKATYTDPAVPQNVVSDRRIFRHDTLVATSHTSVKVNEFGGKSDRHSECSDCHDSHQANGTDSVATATGFTNSGRLKGSSGVSVVNGVAGAAPTYTYLPGGANPITREYQLCFKCHSGFTTLDSNAGFGPSRHRLDKGIEFNPANPSFHPVEAPGKNTSAKMTASLAGPSPYKQWNLTNNSTISCANCHSNYLRYNLVTKPALTASAPLHASNTAGILRQPYRNRLLKPQNEAYKDADFALCLMCHSNTPFATDGGGSDRTNFPFHGYHTAALAGQGLIGTLIDQPGAGGGNAICAECHFRQHSTTFKDVTIPQTINGTRLVSFSPNVQASGGVRKWTSTGVGQGSCTLTCHGKNHAGTVESYP